MQSGGGDVSEHPSMPPDFAAMGDAALVFAIARYEQAALAEAYRRHGGAVHGLAKRLLLDDAAAEEVVQEVFLRLWNDPERFDPGRGALRSYLLAHVHGRSVDLVRAESARRSREERDARRAVTPDRDLEREVWELTLHEHVRAALTGLNDGERKAIELAYFGGHTYREVADLLGEPEGTVKSRIRTGLARMRDSLKTAGLVGLEGPWAET